MNRRLKRIVEKGMRQSGLAAAARGFRRRDVIVFTYHNIVPEGEPVTGDRSLHLSQGQFARQLDWLRRTYEVVSLPDLLEANRSHRRPRAAITFDDAYRGAVTVGVTELADRDMPATIFVAPAFIGGSAFWWDLLAPRTGDDLPEVRQHCIETLEGRNDRVLDWAEEHQIPLRCVPQHETVATEDELAASVVSARITLAAHTWSHPNLRCLGDAELQEELGRPFAWLKARFDQVIPWLSYPYGLASAEVAESARASAYDAALINQGGSVNRAHLETGRHMLPRCNVPAELTLDGFTLRASGLLSR